MTISATSTEEFNAMLREFLVHSGLKPNQIATRTKIPRSQIYALFAPGRVSLPTKRDQIIAILKVLRASDDQIRRVLAVWQGLYLSRPMPGQPGERSTELMTSAVDAARREIGTAPAGNHDLDPTLIPTVILAATGAIMLAAANISPEATSASMRTATAVGGVLFGLAMPAVFPVLARTCGPRLRGYRERLARLVTTT